MYVKKKKEKTQAYRKDGKLNDPIQDYVKTCRIKKWCLYYKVP